MGEGGRMKKSTIIWIVIGGLVVVFLLTMLGYYNKFVTLNETIDQSWAEIDNQLKRRADLIPNLVNTVKGYASHERGIFTQVAEARSKLIGAKGVKQTAEAARGFESALGRLLAIAERYPDLKASQNFTQLMDELAGTENRLSVARMRYNREVRSFNVSIKRFPGKVFAGWFGYSEPRIYFQVEEAAKETPKVEF